MALTKVSTDGVKDDAITKSKIPANQIEASELADNAVDTNAIADQAVALSKLPHGTSSNDGKFLRANNGADPTFETVTGTTINNNVDNRVITGSGTANTLNAESTLTYDASLLNITSTTQGLGLRLTNTGNEYTEVRFDAARTGAGSALGILTGRWNNSHDVAQIYLQSGDDTTNKDDGRISFNTQSASGSSGTRLRIEPDGKIGIGTTSPDQTLHVHKGSAGSISSTTNSVLTLENSNDSILQFLSPSSNVNQIRFGDQADNGAGYIDYNHGNNALTFGTNGPEKMRLDASGNLGIGTTSPSSILTTEQSAGNINLELHATGSGRGSQIKCHNDHGTAYLGLAGNTNGELLIYQETNAPTLFHTNGQERMRLLAGGGLTFNGDTAAANALDDYEEGTWTPTCVTGTLNYGHTTYTKIGRMCYITTYVNNFSDRSSSSAIEITSLPYAPANESDCGACVFYRVAHTDEGQVACRTSTSGNKILFLVSSQGGGESWFHLTHSDLNHANSQIKFSIWYAVA